MKLKGSLLNVFLLEMILDWLCNFSDLRSQTHRVTGVSLISKSPRITANCHRIAAGSTAVRIIRYVRRLLCVYYQPHSNDALEMLVRSFARGHHMYCFLQLRQQFFIDKTFNFINFMWRTATKSFIRHALFIPPCHGQSWKCVAVLSRRYARGAIWRKTVYKLLKWRHWRV